jgi:inosose dehydratase
VSQIQFGCQFYTWQMSGRYVGKLPHILQVVENSGFAGIEPETCMLGEYYEDSLALKDLLDQHGLQLGAITLVCDWAGPVETDEERAEAERLFGYLDAFPGTHLMLCQMPGRDRSDLRRRQGNAIACVNAVAARAVDRGLACSFHPNSPPGSVFRVLEDYEILLDGLDRRVVGYAPDTGHIAAGGIDVYQLLETYRSTIAHVHFKDINAAGAWAAMGAGVLDFPRIVTTLREAGYAGWIMVEEESVAAESEPDAATLANGEYLRQELWPLVRQGDSI